ncbi:oxidoreductase [Rhizocola hellebori]|uniref:Oxidoreductase n=1 Tax=Rhizocola hellebori TaxID=1392758 RepID=A0A8J3Q6J2_9ACTN|nr:NAD(P)-dependent oxidoreductase [Rhizocola hellebori]GIH04874.1 oxidoreductase [Rhizocola hellebori]
MTAESVAVVGTGRMGAAMAGRLLGAGHRVTLYNRSPQRAAALGAPVAATAREAVAQARFVVVSLADDDAVRAVYSGAEGIVAGLGQGAVVMETSTIHPATVRELAAAVTGRGAHLLDTPVSGSVALVQRGELTVLAGGDGDALERARPILGAFGSRIAHLGGQGSGATMKLVVNSVVHGLNQAVAEALVLAERAGVDRAAAYDVFASSAVAAPFVQYKREAYLNPDTAAVAFALELVAKDLRLIGDLAGSVGARMPQLAANASVVEEALTRGYGDRDMSALAKLLRGG